jgi:small basic protein
VTATLATAPAVADATVAAAVAATVPASTGFRRKALGISIVAGAALSSAGFATTVWESGSAKLDYLNSLVVHPTQSQVAALLLHLGYMMFAPLLVVLAAMTRAARSRLTSVAFGVAALGALSLPGLLVTDFYDLAIRQTLPDDLAVRVSDKAGSYPLAAVMMAPTLLALLLGLIVAMIAAVRAKFLHWALVPVFVVGFLFPPFVSDKGWFLNVVPVSVELAAIAAVGIRVLRMSDAEYATGVRA